MTLRRLAFPLLLVSVATFPAEAKTVGILVFGADPSGASDVREAARLQIIAHTALEVVSPEAFAFSRTTAEFRTCAGSSECFSAMASESSAALDLLLILSTANLEGGRVFSYRKVPTGPNASGREVVGVVRGPPSEPLADVLERALPLALPEDWGQVGRVAVEVVPAGAQVSAGAVSCVAPCELSRLEAGPLDLDIVAPGYAPRRVRAVVLAGGVERLNVELSEAADRSSLLSSPWFWVIGGAVVAAGAVTGIVVAAQGGPRTCFASSPELCPW